MGKKYEMSSLSKAYAKDGQTGIEVLLKEGADINETDSDQRTVLMNVVSEKDLPTIEFLLKKGVDINVQDSNGWTALAFAAQANSAAITALLLKYKPVIDTQDSFGNTPLWRAVMNSKGEGEVIKLLLKHGADRNIKNKSGNSPVDVARKVTNYNIVQYLE